MDEMMMDEMTSEGDSQIVGRPRKPRRGVAMRGLRRVLRVGRAPHNLFVVVLEYRHAAAAQCKKQDVGVCSFLSPGRLSM